MIIWSVSRKHLDSIDLKYGNLVPNFESLDFPVSLVVDLSALVNDIEDLETQCLPIKSDTSLKT